LGRIRLAGSLPSRRSRVRRVFYKKPLDGGLHGGVVLGLFPAFYQRDLRRQCHNLP